MLKLIIALLSNLVAILAIKYLVPGVEVTNDLVGLAALVVLFTIANSFILPMLRFMFKPFIWVTLGLLAVVFNGILIYIIVDILPGSITINGLVPLVISTVIVGIINAFFALGAKAFD